MILMAIILTIKMEDDREWSYDSIRQYIYLARLTILTHSNWTQRSVVFVFPKINSDQHD